MCRRPEGKVRSSTSLRRTDTNLYGRIQVDGSRWTQGRVVTPRFSMTCSPIETHPRKSSETRVYYTVSVTSPSFLDSRMVVSWGTTDV